MTDALDTAEFLQVSDQRAGLLVQDLRTYIADVLHEVRSPLGAIIGFGDLIYRGKIDSDPATIREYAGYISRCARELETLLNDTADFARTRIAPGANNPEPADLADLIVAVVRSLECVASAHAIRLTIELPEAPAPLTVDKHRARQTAIGFVLRAIDAAARGETVAIGFEPSGADAVRLVVSWPPNGASPEGLSPAELGFEQVMKGVAGAPYGSMLGLALAKYLCEDAGGRIGFDVDAANTRSLWAILPCLAVDNAAVDPAARNGNRRAR